ncbi:MAG: hypothetical protein QOJ56_1781 [Mycobacterium sp.]|jgi:hypothetical protein|nr:hypothetical protein [Mycobacterium sp.]
MGVKNLASRPFTAALADSAAPGQWGQKFCGFHRVPPIGGYARLLNLQHGTFAAPPRTEEHRMSLQCTVFDRPAQRVE